MEDELGTVPSRHRTLSFSNPSAALRALCHVRTTALSLEPLMPQPAGSASAEEFVERHLHTVWRYLRMHGAEHDEADDLTQEAFVTALQKGVMQLDPPAAQVFLRRTARFAFLHHLRDRRRDPALADAVDELWDRDAEHDGGDGLVTALQSCVERLDGRARRAIARTYGIGETAAASRDDVAGELGLQPNGLKTLLQRTRQVLRACIERRAR